jgi:phosphate transport system permease protein
VVNPALRSATGSLGSQAVALVDLCKFILSVGLTLALAWGVSFLLARGTSWIPGTDGGSLGWMYWSGWDPRGGSSFLGTYDQRNALIVGFVMGFAIIPIIYTIAEDALSTVPDHLRAASLGAGATPWQTATRIVIPTAMSGLFSAVMIGLGRAVGETMIVLMAAGNIPVMEWNIFNGMRTLAANIAVEMPEAAEGSTHWRTLFLAALVLFAMTFVVNTAAELVRLRFRKKAYQL